VKIKQSPLFLLATLALAGAAAHAAVITDFSSFTESGNLIGPSNIPASVNTREQTFTTSSNVITVTSASGSNAGQEVFLSDSFSIATVGKMVSVDYGSTTNFGTPLSGSSALGLAVASSETITSRNNLLLFYYRRATTTGSFTANGGVGFVYFDGSGANDAVVNTTFTTITFVPDSLFIKKTANGFDLGYIEGGIQSTAFSLTNTANPKIAGITGSAVGVYTDARNGNYSYKLENLNVVPEPGAALLGSFGMLALLRRRR
jgi:hypothetical protein